MFISLCDILSPSVLLSKETENVKYWLKKSSLIPVKKPFYDAKLAESMFFVVIPLVFAFKLALSVDFFSS